MAACLAFALVAGRADGQPTATGPTAASMADGEPSDSLASPRSPSQTSTPAASATWGVTGLTIGFAGRYKVGHWTPLWVTFAPGDGFEGVLEIEAPDADAVPVLYRQPLRLTPGEPATVESLLKIGRRTGRLTVRLRAAPDSALSGARSPASSVPESSAPESVTAETAHQGAGAVLWSTTVTFDERLDPRADEAPASLFPTTEPTGEASSPSDGRESVSMAPSPRRLTIPAPLSASAELVVNFGRGTLLTETSTRRLETATTPSREVFVRLTDTSPLPTRWAAWEAVDLVLITTAEVNPLARLTGSRREAFLRHLALGGRAFVTLGQSAPPILADETWASVLAPGRFDGVAQLPRAERLRNFSGVDDPIPLAATPADFAVFESPTWSVISQEGQALGQGATLFTRRYGFGRLTVAAVDLDRPPFADWRGRDRLVRRTLAAGTGRSDAPPVVTGAGEGDDLAVQLRGALAQFTGVSVVGFLSFTGLLVLYVALIGPGDWWLLRRFGRRMRWTWLTASTLIVVCLAAAGLASSALKGTTRINQAELIDWTQIEPGGPWLTRGISWAELYSPTGRTATMTATLPERFAVETDADEPTSDNVLASDASANDASAEPARPGVEILFNWQGAPGGGLGGMSSTGPLFQDAPTYQADVTPRREAGQNEVMSSQKSPGQTETLAGEAPLAAGTTATARLIGVPMLPASSKSVAAIWSGFEPRGVSSRFVLETAGRFHGTMTNPLTVPLTDVMVIHRVWVHSLGGPIGPGEAITVERGRYPQTLEWRLRRRENTTGRETLEAWNPEGRDLARILEVMMFHQAAGGREYTAGLSQMMYDRLDLSDVLDEKTVVVIARIAEPRLAVTTDAPTPEPDRREAFVRFLLPIEDRTAETAIPLRSLAPDPDQNRRLYRNRATEPTSSPESPPETPDRDPGDGEAIDHRSARSSRPDGDAEL